MLLAVSNGKRRKFASLGIAFVTYSKKAGMEKALEMNEQEYEGRNIYVRDRSLKFQLISFLNPCVLDIIQIVDVRLDILDILNIVAKNAYILKICGDKIHISPKFKTNHEVRIITILQTRHRRSPWRTRRERGKAKTARAKARAKARERSLTGPSWPVLEISR